MWWILLNILLTIQRAMKLLAILVITLNLSLLYPLSDLFTVLIYYHLLFRWSHRRSSRRTFFSSGSKSIFRYTESPSKPRYSSSWRSSYTRGSILLLNYPIANWLIRLKGPLSFVSKGQYSADSQLLPYCWRIYQRERDEEASSQQ
jgi:hypothetical protein